MPIPTRRAAAASLALALPALLVLACSDSRDADPSGEPAAPRAAAATPLDREQILFGDLHVHTTYSWDAFLFSLPISGGEGTHPPDDACDFARYCAELDFFAITDHAESLLPKDWAATKESIRQCNARANDPANPDIVAFAGFEWSQAASTPEEHWGHRCVVYPGILESELPARAIASKNNAPTWAHLARGMRRGISAAVGEDAEASLGASLSDAERAPIAAFAQYLETLGGLPQCAEGVASPALPASCLEVATTPAALERKLDEWGLPALVIPHGTSWGIYTPALSSLARHLDPEQYRPERQRLIEIMSGHGNSEEYRPWRPFLTTDEGENICSAPSSDYLSCCWQAGVLTRARCGAIPADECDARVEDAMDEVMDAWDIGYHRVVPDASPEEWLDCGQCRDCFKPAFEQRPMESVQYAMSRSYWDDEDGEEGNDENEEEQLRFRFGFVASSDGHGARPGTGYKQVERMGMMTDANPAPATEALAELRELSLGPVDGRVGSFLYPGGLVAVHAAGRDRAAIWDALESRSVYGTSGPRILLWFSLVNGAGGPQPMGSEHRLAHSPAFEVRAVGSYVQQPGCSDEAASGLGAERLALLCRNECYNPSDARRPIERIEVVRIRPQRTPGEPVEGLIDDPWLILPCPGDPAGCTVQFVDEEFPGARRDTLYYVRALEAPSEAINGQPLETQFDENGNATGTSPCVGDMQALDDPNCLAPVMERAWSSPIFVDYATLNTE